jgi:catechol 2,3-dioxygenase-like lactoylglutathione lyase family enzyme
MTSALAPDLSHVGIYCRDVDLLQRFYTGVFGLVETDRGTGKTFKMTLVFLSGRPDQHHQLVLAEGRGPDSPSTVMQLSFKVTEIDHLREIRHRALGLGATDMRGLNHGNALSIYFFDPEGNTIEVYLDTPWYVTQPHGDPLNLTDSDDEIWTQTERVCRADPTFMPVDEWQQQFRHRHP